MVTQIDQIIEILLQVGRGNLTSTDDLFKTSGIRRPSIRRITSKLVRTGRLDRLEPGIFKVTQGIDSLVEKKRGIIEDGSLHQKFIGTAKYRGQARQWFALTEERNDVDREDELLRVLKQHLNDAFVDATGDTGYSDTIIPEAQSTGHFYPDIQVGEL